MTGSTDPDQGAAGPGYVLAWPHQLVTAELTGILTGGEPLRVRDELELLLAEAFLGRAPADDLDAAGRDDSWDGPATGARAFGVRLLADLDTYPQHLPTLAPPAGRGGGGVWPWAQRAWRQAVAGLNAAGYFDHAAGGQCESPDGGLSGHDDRMRDLVLEQAGIDLPWPPHHPAVAGQVLPEGRFYSLIEAVGDLAARPRRRWWHEEGNHYDYGHFDRPAGRAVYRWAINQLLTAAAPGTHLTRAGHLVTTPAARATSASGAASRTGTSPEGDVVPPLLPGRDAGRGR